MTKSNRFTFGVGTIGRDMSYTLISMYLMFYLTDIMDLNAQMILILTAIIVTIRVFDAFNDPFMGVIVDNTRSRFGKFKPWIFVGLVGSAITSVLMFSDFGLTDTAFIIVFTLSYVLWELFFTMNDIAYWSMLPALTQDQKEREEIGSWARVFANLGVFIVVGGLIPITNYFKNDLNMTEQNAFFTFVFISAILMVIGQLVTIRFTKVEVHFAKVEQTKISEMFGVILKNDQLLWAAIAMSLFMTGYMITTNFGLHFFKYAYKDESMYGVFGIVLGASQMVALLVFRFLSNQFTRKQLFTGAIGLVLLGYVLFFIAPMDIIWIGLAGIIMFFGQGMLQLIILVLLADTVEYGHYKLGKRNESVSFAIQPFVNKLSGAIASLVIGVTLVWIGITEVTSPSEVTDTDVLYLKLSMLVLPVILIIASYLIYYKCYKIDKKMYDQIIETLKKRDDEFLAQNEDNKIS
ncbi:glycoside-pentoside-hexuronide (GPH):cation symporter [Acholeplasma manati]|uniref:Glycoside-pentoside-hexuronide (GPH):cation symporter n=2 Tax=Paracholeplasma manati TaxID=591373 RepID=A0ABT2Y6J2_9MOLU|nr:glycoside-pentoside-hexuronide (GPH):cation symporter [Paracholeplasma manati]MCV2232364.1 glycoside-pentoside-hexuronide (GPH):cation symporter [Paracholeplasma manati]MDG0888051.1 glycoside-pentoside-hexuronide (GPH):cation symporter [Paracholeplasma manati]